MSCLVGCCVLALLIVNHIHWLYHVTHNLVKNALLTLRNLKWSCVLVHERGCTDESEHRKSALLHLLTSCLGCAPLIGELNNESSYATSALLSQLLLVLLCLYVVERPNKETLWGSQSNKTTDICTVVNGILTELCIDTLFCPACLCLGAGLSFCLNMADSVFHVLWGDFMHFILFIRVLILPQCA